MAITFAAGVAARVSFALAAAAARRLASPKRLPTHLPVARALALAFVADLGRPIAKAMHAPIAVDRALYLVFPVVSAWIAAEVLALPRRAIPVARAVAAALWLAGAVAIARADYPRRSPELRELMLDVHLEALAIELASAGVLVASCLQRAGRRWTWRRAPTPTETAALMLIAGDIGELAGPWVYGDRLWLAWDLARWQWAAVYLMVAAFQWRRGRWVIPVRP